MDIDDIFEMFDIDPDDEGVEQPEPPDFRATLRGHRLMVTTWGPHLLAGGPNGALVRERAADGVTVADLWVTEAEPHELVVRFLAVADRERAERRLTHWAESVGYARMWLPDQIVALDGDKPFGSAAVRCVTCGATWQDGDPEFWAGVRKRGAFPNLCPICNTEMPQWRWRPAKAIREAAPGRRQDG